MKRGLAPKGKVNNLPRNSGANILYLGSSGISMAAKRGEKYLNADMVIMKQIMDAIEK